MHATTRNFWLRNGLLFVVGFITLVTIPFLFYDSYGSSVALHEIASNWHSTLPLKASPATRRANAAIVMLTRNNELEEAVSSMRQLEDRFNKRYHYPWVFLNDEPFTDEFKRRTSIMTDANVTFGLIPREQWVQPDWIDEDKAKTGRNKLEADRIVYGGSVSYRNMCRFNSGYFYRHELLKDFRFYWRVEPNVLYYCDIDYDPFLYMQDEEKVYGFTMSMYEHRATVPTLWNTTKEFLVRYPQYVHPDNALNFLSEDAGKSWNWCHFWSNFEIADMDFWRSEAYSRYFDHLDRAGGFYYERWGDAPVHSIAAALFLPKDKLHFFSDIGYKHSVYQRCPTGRQHTRGKCWCNPNKDNFDYDGFSCLSRWNRVL